MSWSHAISGMSAAIGLIVSSCALPDKPDPGAQFNSEADLVVEDWTAVLSDRFRALAVLPENEFIIAWRAERDSWVARLRALDSYVVGSSAAELYEARVHYEWALGRFYYPSAHQALAEQPDYRPSGDYDNYFDELDLARADFLGLEEYTNFLVLLRNQKSNALKAELGDLLNDGTRDLTSRRLANEKFDPAVQCFLDREALDYWLENFAADGLIDEVDQLVRKCPGDKTDAIRTRYEAEIAERDGHTIEIFKTVDGHELEMHIYRPEGVPEGAPVTVWFHGGGWRTGSWSWCGPCVWLKQRGHVVAQVEYRITGRHGTTIDAALADAYDAVSWMRSNAERFGGDPERVMTAGFSAGGHLSLGAATFGQGSSKPDMAVALSPCTDLTNDGYTIGLSRGYTAARAMSPRYHVSPALPAIFMASADEDTDCSFEASVDYVERVKEAGVEIRFVDQIGAGHFFLRDPDRAEETRQELAAFLDENGF